MEQKLELEDSSSLASSFHNIALVYQELEDYDNAENYFDQALELLNIDKDKYDLAICYNNLALLHYNQQEYEESLFYINESMILNEAVNNRDGICSNLNSIANTLMKQERLSGVQDYIERSLIIAVELQNKELIAKNYETFSIYYELLNQPQIALKYFKKFKALKDSINTEINNQIITQLGIQYETTNREKEIELLKAAAAHHNQVRNYLIYVLVFGIAIIIFLINMYYVKIKDGRIRQEVQDKLKESEIRFRSLTENLKSIVFTFDVSGKFTYVNPITSKISGYSEEELLNMNFFDIIHPDHRQIVSRRGFDRLQNENVVSAYDIKTLTKNGEIRWIRVSNDRVVIGNQILILGSATDITESKILHEKLHSSESHLKALFAAMEDLIFVMDKKGKYISIAPTNPDLLYKPADELLGKTLYDIFDKDNAKFFIEKITLCLSAQEMVSFDYHMDIHGSTYWFDARVTPLDKDTVLYVGRDITEEKDSMHKLIESEEKYRNLVESIEEGMTIVDEDLNFVFVNNAACKILGYTKIEMLDMNVQDIIPEENKEMIREQHKNRLEKKSTTYENWNIRKDGERRLMKISSSPLRFDDEVISTISLFSDVTELRETEEKIKASLREKEVMLQEIYHRVKNNMQIISSMLKLQSRYINKENALEVFKNSQNRVKSMSLIHEKLYRSTDLSRIEIHDYLKSLLKQLFISYRASLQGINYEVDCDDINLNISTAIPCGLIVNELVTNSMKHAFRNQENGLIFIRLHKMPNDLFRLEIGNNGTDFPADFTLENAQSFGLQLVDILRSQLHAEFRLDTTDGVNFIFIFKEIIK